jgi:hypothetical protein
VRILQIQAVVAHELDHSPSGMPLVGIPLIQPAVALAPLHPVQLLNPFDEIEDFVVSPREFKQT